MSLAKTTLEHKRDPKAGYAVGRARRQEIVRVAAQEFAQKGFAGATILDVAAACGISRAGLMHHFPNKEELLEAVLEDRDEADRVSFEPYVRDGGAIGVLVGLVELAAHNRLNPNIIELFVRLSSEAAMVDHPAHDYFRQRYERITSGTARALTSLQRRSLVRKDADPVEFATRLVALMDGLQSLWLMNRTTDMAAHIEAAVLEFLTPEGRAQFREQLERAMVDELAETPAPTLP